MIVVLKYTIKCGAQAQTNSCDYENKNFVGSICLTLRHFCYWQKKTFVFEHRFVFADYRTGQNAY